MNVNDLIDEYYDAREAYDNAKKLATELDRRRRAAENKLIDHMLDEGTTGVKRDDGTSVGLRQSVSLSCNKENYEDLREWLIEATGDDSDFVEEVVSRVALTELVKARIAEGADESDFPEAMRVSTRPIISVQGWKNRS